MNKDKSEWFKASIILIILFSIIAIYALVTFQVSSEKKLLNINKSYIKKKFIAPNGESLSLIIVGEHHSTLSGKIKITQNNQLIYNKIFNVRDLPKGEFIYKLERYKYANYELVPIGILKEKKIYSIELQLNKKLSDDFSLWLGWLFSYI